MPPALVTMVTAVAKDVPFYLDEPVGKAVASESVIVQPQVTGMLTARHFEDGAFVKTGQLLFEIDARPFQAAVDQAQANLVQAQAALDYAKNDYQRYKALDGQPAVSEEEIEQKENTVEVDAAAVQAAQAGLETAKLNLEYCRITSPIDGRAGARQVDSGNVVNNVAFNGSGTNLLTIQKLDPIYVDFTITERQLPMVRQYMAGGTLKVEAELPEDLAPSAAGPSTQPFQPRDGELIFLDNAVQDGSGTVKLRAQLPNVDHHFWPGQFVNVRLVLKVEKDAVLIPNQAAQVSQTGPFVYVVKSDNTAELRPIVLGQRQGDLVVVEKGLAAGEQIVNTGQTLVFSGGAVMTAPAAGAGNGQGGKT